MVDVLVGAERKKFHLHRDLLCDRSDYFKACFEGNFMEAQQNELFLPEDDSKSFDLFVGWLYGGTLKKISSNAELPAYFALVVLASKLCLEHLRNETMDHILRFHRTNPVFVDYQSLRMIDDNSSSDDCFYVYLLCLAVWTVVSKQAAGALLDHKDSVLIPDYERLISEGGNLAVNLTHALLEFYNTHDYQNSALMDPRRRSNCFFHKHNSTPVCGKLSN